MRFHRTLCTALALAAPLFAAPAMAQDEPAESLEAPAEPVLSEAAKQAGLTTYESRAAYAIGLQLGQSIKDSPFPIEMEKLEKGIQDILAGNTPALTVNEVREVLLQLRQQMQDAARERRMKEAEENIGKAEAYLAENAKKEGVKTTESGLQYRVLREGDGPSPKETSQVRVHYKGTLTDGTQFDSSYDRGQPASFGLNQVIPGWTEGLQLMKTGAKYELTIPPGLGYGAGGADTIPPNSVLIFEVELLEVLDDAGNGGQGGITIE
ncbi:MAG: hypothetical protein RLZZ303_3291 [Candidatus Hydrogenedentota bacterium]|jgi:FKBP-type peptidyl-prolyl cis-trans isomerase